MLIHLSIFLYRNFNHYIQLNVFVLAFAFNFTILLFIIYEILLTV